MDAGSPGPALHRSVKAASAAAWGRGVAGPGRAVVTVTARSRPGVSEPRPRAQQAQSLSRDSQNQFGVCGLSPSAGISWGSAARGVRRGTGLPGKGGGMELGVSDGVLFPLFQGALHPPWLLGPGPGHMAEMRSWGSS